MTIADLPLLVAAGVLAVVFLIVLAVFLVAVADHVSMRRMGQRLEFDLLGELPMLRGAR